MTIPAWTRSVLALGSCALAVAASHRVAGPAHRHGCMAEMFEGERIVACPYDPARHALRLTLGAVPEKPYRSLPALAHRLSAQDRAQIAFAMNAGMYDVRSQPIGLYVEGGVARVALNARSGAGNFHLKPNGVFWVDREGGAHVDTTDQYAALNRRAEWATQSGPMLVIDGQIHPRFEANGTSRKNRNGVGVDQAGITWFAISDRPVSFGLFARYFRDKRNCPNALYLDGSVSSLWDPANGRMDNHYFLGPLVVVSWR